SPLSPSRRGPGPVSAPAAFAQRRLDGPAHESDVLQHIVAEVIEFAHGQGEETGLPAREAPGAEAGEEPPERLTEGACAGGGGFGRCRRARRVDRLQALRGGVGWRRAEGEPLAPALRRRGDGRAPPLPGQGGALLGAGQEVRLEFRHAVSLSKSLGTGSAPATAWARGDREPLGFVSPRAGTLGRGRGLVCGGEGEMFWN